ncbi:hypothetical protein ALO85_200078 [Pseudomonas syringae pv. aptata]|nr:hypothetical protein ALO85_200078 [Pseudomonas syringae pv. aptata]
MVLTVFSALGILFLLLLLGQSLSFRSGSPFLFRFVSGQFGFPCLFHAVVTAQIHVQGRVLLDVGFIDLGAGGFHLGNGEVPESANHQQPYKHQPGHAQVKRLLVLGIACAFGPHIKGPTGLGASGLGGRGLFRGCCGRC